MAKTTQLLKGIMEGVILKVVSKEETYGYEIYQKLQENGFEEFKEGSLYPLLLRLEKNGLIQSIKKSSPLGPDRKYYSLTKDGELEMKEFFSSWMHIDMNIRKLWGE